MGYEIECGAVVDGVVDRGKALLESDYVLFRGTARIKLMFAALRSVATDAGELTVATDDHTLVLELGAQAERWADKIRNPKSLLDKLGVKPGEAVALVDVTDSPFLATLHERGVPITYELSAAKFIFLQVEELGELAQVATVVSVVGQGAALWIVAPKGRSNIKDVAVIEAGRAAGLVDVKVCSFSATHTALKFVRRSSL